MTRDEAKDLMELLQVSAPVALQIVNAVPAFHVNEAIQSLALMGASAAIAKQHGMVTRTQFLEAAALIWDTGKAEFETYTERMN